jgi:hypothetical protein
MRNAIGALPRKAKLVALAALVIGLSIPITVAQGGSGKRIGCRQAPKICKMIRNLRRKPGPTGPRGAQGAAGASALNAVPSGQTIHGVVGGDFHAFDNSASDFGTDVTLPMPAANALSDNDVFVNVAGWQDAGGQTTPTTTDTNAGCNGTPAAPTAPAGKVCIYVSGADHAFNLAGYSVLFGTGASPYGFKLKWDASQAGDTFVDATWAYTAP